MYLSFSGSGVFPWLSPACECPPLYLTPTHHSPQDFKPVPSLVTIRNHLVPKSYFIKGETDPQGVTFSSLASSRPRERIQILGLWRSLFLFPGHVSFVFAFVLLFSSYFLKSCWVIGAMDYYSLRFLTMDSTVSTSQDRPFHLYLLIFMIVISCIWEFQYFSRYSLALHM